MDGKFFQLHTVIKERRNEPGAYYFPDPWWEKEINAIVSDMETAEEFVNVECTDEELYWLAEILDDIIEKTKSHSFLESYSRRAALINNPEWKKIIRDDIKTASDYLERKMDVNDYNYLWKSEKENWVLVNTEFGYGIVNKATQMGLMISDEELENALIKKMIAAGNQVYENINDAYNDIKKR